MKEVIVNSCWGCPFLSLNLCTHEDADMVVIKLFSIPSDCPLIKEETVIKVKND